MSAQERSTEILEIAQDKLAGFISVSDNDHKYIHKGQAFIVAGNTGSLSSGSTYYTILTTPPASAEIFVHLRPTQLASTANILLMQVYEGPTVSNAGTGASPVNLNRNRQGIIIPKATVSVGSTISADGTLIQQWAVGAGGSGSGNSGGSAGAGVERVLRPETTYAFKFTNIGSTTATTGYYELFWYSEAKGQE